MLGEKSIIFQIRIKERIDSKWGDWFAPLQIVDDLSGTTILTGLIRDQAELHSLLEKIFNLNLTLLAVNCLPDGEL